VTVSRRTLTDCRQQLDGLLEDLDQPRLGRLALELPALGEFEPRPADPEEAQDEA